MLKRREEKCSGSVSLSGSTATFNGFQQSDRADTSRTSLLEVMMVMSGVRQTWLVLTTSSEPERFKAAFEFDFFRLFLFLTLRQNLHFISLFSTGRRFHVNQLHVKNKEQNQRRVTFAVGAHVITSTKTWDKNKESSRRRRMFGSTVRRRRSTTQNLPGRELSVVLVHYCPHQNFL